MIKWRFTHSYSRQKTKEWSGSAIYCRANDDPVTWWWICQRL